jgi:hypothetical protein
MQQMLDWASQSLQGNPFGGLANALIQSVQIDVGPYVIGLGILMLVSASLWGMSLSRGQS